jgi:nitrite reductase/ring-hydroxylating ferredoxin subunit
MIAVARSGGELYAIEDGQIVCPRHGARFKALIAVTLV